MKTISLKGIKIMNDHTPRIEITGIIEELRIKYSIQLKNVLYTQNEYVINNYTNKYKSELVNTINHYRETDENVDTHQCFIHKTDNVFSICTDYFLESSGYILIIFYDDNIDIQKFIHDKKETFYPVDTYTVKSGMFGYELKKINVKDDSIPFLNDDIFIEINTDINRFFNMREFYTKNNLPFKRGILFYGPPGTGKTSSIRHVLKQNTDKYGIIFNCRNEFSKDLGTFINQLSKVHPVIFIIEDIDGIDSYNRSELLNLLDGLYSLENCFIIATTNHLDKLDTALTNRPSRFDRLYNIDLPNESTREKFINKYFPNLTKEELEKAVKKTEGFTGAYFKELFIFTNLHDCDMNTAIERINNQLALFKKEKEADYYG